MSLMSFLNSINKQKIAVLPDGNASDLDQLFTNLIKKTFTKIETVIKWDNVKIKKYHLRAIKIAERLQRKNEYLDKRIQEKILSYNTYI